MHKNMVESKVGDVNVIPVNSLPTSTLSPSTIQARSRKEGIMSYRLGSLHLIGQGGVHFTNDNLLGHVLVYLDAYALTCLT